MAKIEIEFYGRLSDIMGKALAFNWTGAELTIAGLRAELAKAHDFDALREACNRAVINDEMANEDDRVVPGDRVAFLSPLSGG